MEQKNKKRARVKVAVFSIFALNLLVISPLLIQGCSKKDNGTDQANNAQPADNNTPAPAPDTNNTPPPLPEAGSNAAPASNVVAEPPPAPAPIPVPPPTPAVPQSTEYVVAKGDTYYSIAKKFSIRMSDIKNANPNVNPSKLKVGQKLEIPAAGSSAGGTGATADSGSDTYVVRAGDSLTRIAKANGTTVKAIRAANNMHTDRIKVGEKLKLPVKAAPAVDTTPAPIPQPVPAQPATTASTTAPPPLAAPSSPSGH